MSDGLLNVSAQKQAFVPLDTPQLDERVWRAWIEKGRAQDRVSAGKQKWLLAAVTIAAGIGLILFRVLGG